MNPHRCRNSITNGGQDLPKASNMSSTTIITIGKVRGGGGGVRGS